jgi:hypothetical protein
VGEMNSMKGVTEKKESGKESGNEGLWDKKYIWN